MQVDPVGKAGVEGSLRVGDLVLFVNEVRCSQPDQALELIDSAFRTLTLLVWRRSVPTAVCLAPPLAQPKVASSIRGKLIREGNWENSGSRSACNCHGC